MEVVLARSSTGVMAMTLQGEGHKCSQVDAGKYKNNFFTEIAIFLIYREIYVHIFAIIRKPTQHTGICIV